ncbi:MAG: cobalamin-dependent protein [Bacillota bacterium]
MSAHVVLLTPPYHAGVIEITGTWPPLNLVYLAGALRNKGIQVEIYDAMSLNHSVAEIQARLAQVRPQIVGITATTASAPAAIATLKAVREVLPTALLVMGGIHATFCWEEILSSSPWIDVIIRGEGEETLPELIWARQTGRSFQSVRGIAYREQGEPCATEPRPLIENLDTLAPAWDLLDWELYRYRITDSRLAIVSGSRGCDQECRFCSQHHFWRKQYRERSPESLVKEILELRDRFGVEMVLFADEYTTKNRERWEKFLDLLLEAQPGVMLTMETRAPDIVRDQDILWKYRAAGFIHVYIGVESANQATLDALQKNIKAEEAETAIRLLNEQGILTECSFLLGHWEETPQSIEETLQQALRYNPDLAHFLFLTPWPYADLWQEVAERVEEWDFSKYDLVHPIMPSRAMSREELREAMVRCFSVFYREKMHQYRQQRANDFKKKYMQKSMEVLFNNSFLTEILAGLKR